MLSSVLLVALGSSAVLGTNRTMRSAFYSGVPYSMEVRDVPLPVIINATDAIVRIPTAALCGTDLHIYHGVNGAAPRTMGHEAVGYISAVGNAFSSLRVGQDVVVPDLPGQGHLRTIPWLQEATLFFGNSLPGLQAEYARVPFADVNLVPLPISKKNTTRALEQSFVSVSDIFATAWTAVDFSGFVPGDKVVVFGAGPVGLLAAYSAHLRGASRIYVVDSVDARLKRAAEISRQVVPISNKASGSYGFQDSKDSHSSSDPAVLAIRALEPNGVARVVDAMGYEAVDPATGHRDQTAVLRSTLDVVATGGGVRQVGVYLAADQDGTNDTSHKNLIGVVQFPLARFWGMGLSLRSGPVDPIPLAPTLVNLIASGAAEPGRVIKTAEIGIEDVPEYYARFSKREEIKVFVHFP